MYEKRLILYLLVSTAHCSADFNDFFDTFKINIAATSSLMESNYQFKILGLNDVSEKTIKMIRSIMTELSMSNPETIAIKQMSDRLAQLVGRANALVTANAMYLDENFFETLAHEQQRALIGHELIHIKNKDALRMLVATILAEICWFAGIATIIKYVENHYHKAIAASGLFYSIIWSGMKFHRIIEKQADIQSAQALKCYEGSISLHQNVFVEASEYTFLQKLNRWLGLETHPAQNERVAYLSQLANQC